MRLSGRFNILLVLLSWLVTEESLTGAATNHPVCHSLAQSNVFFMADNYAYYYSAVTPKEPVRCITEWGSRPESIRPGVMGFGYDNVINPWGRTDAQLGFREHTAEIKVVKNGKSINLQPEMDRYRWYPDHVHLEFSGDGLRLEQEISLFDDVLLCTVTLNGTTTGSEIIIEGKSLAPGKMTARDGVVEFRLNDDKYFKGLTECLGISLKNAVIAAPRDTADAGRTFQITAPIVSNGRLQFTIAVAVAAIPDTAIGKVKERLKNPEKYASAAADSWEEYLTRSIPPFACDNEVLRKLYYNFFSCVRINTYRNTHVGNYVCPSKITSWRALAWDEDTAHIITALRWINDPAYLRTAENMTNFFSYYYSEFNYGYLTIAVWELFKRTGNLAFLEKYLNFELERNATINTSTGKHISANDLVILKNTYIVGWDNSIRFAGGRNKSLYNLEYPVEALDLNSFRVRQSQLLAEAARILGRETIALEMDRQALHLAEQVQRVMWDEKSGFYYDVFVDNHQKVPCKSCCGFFPLLPGIPTEAQAERLIAHLNNPQEFRRKFMVPTISHDDPQRSDCYSGDVVGRNNWFIVEGLLRYNPPVAAQIVLASIALCIQNEVPSTGCGYINPDHGGNSYQFMTTDSAAILDLIITRLVGFVPETGERFSLRPIALTASGIGRLHWGPLNYKGHTAEIDWRTEDGYTLIWDGRPVFHSTSPDIYQTFSFTGGVLRKESSPSEKNGVTLK